MQENDTTACDNGKVFSDRPGMVGLKGLIPPFPSLHKQQNRKQEQGVKVKCSNVPHCIILMMHCVALML